MSFVCVDLLEECHLQQPGARITWQSCSFPRRSWHQGGQTSWATTYQLCSPWTHPLSRLKLVRRRHRAAWCRRHLPVVNLSVAVCVSETVFHIWKCHALGKAIEGSHPIWGLRCNWPAPEGMALKALEEKSLVTEEKDPVWPRKDSKKNM